LHIKTQFSELETLNTMDSSSSSESFSLYKFFTQQLEDFQNAQSSGAALERAESDCDIDLLQGLD